MQTAIISGFTSDAATEMKCLGSECNWNSTSTLAICSSCEDVTEVVERDCTFWENDIGGFCDWTFPNGVVLGSSNASEYWTKWNSSANDMYHRYINYPTLGGVDSPAKAVLTIFGAVTLKGPGDPGRALMCGFNMCAKTYDNISSSNGSPRKRVVDEVALKTSAYQQFCRDAFDGATHRNISDCGEGATTNQKLLVSGENHPPMNTSYEINMSDFANIGDYLQELFSVSITSDMLYKRGGFNENQTAFTPNVGAFLADSLDVNKTIQNVAESMTESMRTCPNSTAHTGVALVNKTFIQVQWEWLALPMTLLVMTTVLLITVIIQTHRQKAVVWKSSSLAMLFHFPVGWDIPPGSLSDRYNLEDLAKQMKGQLRDDLLQPAFVKAG